MNELKIEEYIKDEEKDVAKYEELAKSLPHPFSGIIEDIANEEKTHAEMLRHILQKMK